jgi:hypothetical protein
LEGELSMTYPLHRRVRHDQADSPAYFNRILAQIRKSQVSRRKTLSPGELVTTARLQLGEFVKGAWQQGVVVRRSG